jgi:hypothetical protein
LEGIDGELPPKVDVVMGGVHLQVEPLSHFSGRVERIISSDPQVYLNPQYQPGSILRWT